ncbi:MAG: WD40 repeat domain-containing protein, partial [Pirellulaceae bacterium]
GKQVALACSDGTVRLWDVEKSEEMFICRPKAEDGRRSGRLNDIAFSPDGAWFASAEQQGVIRLWDPAGGEEILALRHGGERRGGLICLAVSADGRRLASAYGSNIRVWDIERGGEPLLIEEAHEQETNAIAFSSDGKTLYSTGFGSERVGTGKDRYSKTHSQIRVWDALTGHRTGEIGGKLEEDLTTGMVLTADGKSLMVSSFRAIRAFELPSGRLRYSIRLEESSRRYRRGALDVSPDGQTMAVAMGNASLQIWDLKTRTRRHAVREAHVAAILAVTFNPDGRRAITGSSDGSIRIWNSATGEQIRKFLYAGWTMNLKSVANSPDGKVVAAAGNYSNIRAGTIGAVKLWNAASGELLHEIHLPASGFAMAFSHDGQRLAATTIGPGPFGSTEAATIHLIDVRSGKTLTKLSGHVQTVSAVGFSPDDRELVSIDQDQTIRVWDVAKGKPRSSSEIESNMAAAISTDAAMSVFSQRGRQGRSITLWDVAASKSLWSVDGSTTGFGAHLLDISRDGKRVASCWKDTLSVWSTATANQLHELTDPDAQMSALAFSPDGRQVMTGMNDGTALIWDISSTRATRDPE